MAKTVKLTEQDIHGLIKETVKKILNEAYDNVCPKLEALKNRFGGIKQVNLPDGVSIDDIQSEDIKKVTNNPGEGVKYSVMLGSGLYAVINPEAPAIVKALQTQREREVLRQKRGAEIDAANKAGSFQRLASLSPEEHKEAQKLMRQRDRIESGDPGAFSSMKQVQKYIEEKYGQYLEFLTLRTRRGREWVYEARITYTASSYADGPSYVPDACVKDVTNFLGRFGFYYDGCREDHDERKWSTNGWHTWYRNGYSPRRYMLGDMYGDDEEW